MRFCRFLLVFLVVGALLAVRPVTAAPETPARMSLIGGVASETASFLVQTAPRVPAQIRYNAADCCWDLDFVEAFPDASLVKKAFVEGPVRLVRPATVCQEPRIQRLSFFIVPGTEMKCREKTFGLELIFQAPRNRSLAREVARAPCFSDSPSERVAPDAPGDTGQRMARGPARQPLMIPAVPKDDVELHLHHFSGSDLIRNLAEMAGKPVFFRDLPANRVSIDARFSNLRTALERVAHKAGLVLTEEDGTFVVSHPRNPLLVFMSAPVAAAMANTQTLTIRAFLDGLPQRKAAARLKARVPADALDQPVPAEMLGMSQRGFVDQLLQSHGLQAREVLAHD